MANDLGGGYADITTRANLQDARDTAWLMGRPSVVLRLADLGLTSPRRGRGQRAQRDGQPDRGH